MNDRLTLNELNQGYYFHDSILNRIEYAHKELKMYCTFCEFLQEDYDEVNMQIVILSLYSIMLPIQLRTAH